MTAKWQYKQAYEAALVTARELRSENAKLREDYDSLAKEHVQTIVELSNAYREEDRLKAENAKLRELVREVWTYAEQELVCDWTCSYGATCDWKDCVFRRRMRELGVEVSDD